MGEAGLVRDKIEGTQELIVEYGRVGGEGKIGEECKEFGEGGGSGRESG